MNYKVVAHPDYAPVAVAADRHSMDSYDCLSFHKGDKVVAVFKEWKYFWTVEPAEVPMCNPKTSPGVIG